MNLRNITLSLLLLLSSNLTLADYGREHGDWNRGGDRQHGDGQRDGNQIGFPNQGPSWPSPASAAVVELQINNYFNGMAQLDLLQDYYIAGQLQGKAIKDITIFAATERGLGTAALLINGQQIEREQVVSQRVNSYTFRVDPFGNILGRNLRTLSLNMRGNFFIEKVVFNLLENSGRDSGRDPFPMPVPRNEVIHQQVNQRIMEEGGVELFRLFGLGLSRQGQIVKRITLTASSMRGGGMAELLVNGQSTGMQQRINEMSNAISFDLAPGSRIGQAIQSLQIHIRGGVVNIEDVAIEFESQISGPGLPDRMSRRFEKEVDQRLYDSNGIDITRLAMTPAQLDARIVDSVELTITNADMGTKLSLCQVQSGQFQRVDCGMQTFVSGGRQTIRLIPQGIVRLSDLSLAVRMGMIDLDVIAINFR